MLTQSRYTAPPGARRSLAGLAAVLALASASGCVGLVRTPAAPARNVPETFEAVPAFRYTVPGPVRLSAPVDSTRFHDVLELTYGSAGSNGAPDNLVEGRYYRSRSPGALKLVVVPPPCASM